MISFDVVPYTLQTDWKWVTECKYRSKHSMLSCLTRAQCSSCWGCISSDCLECVLITEPPKLIFDPVNLCDLLKESGYPPDAAADIAYSNEDTAGVYYFCEPCAKDLLQRNPKVYKKCVQISADKREFFSEQKHLHKDRAFVRKALLNTFPDEDPRILEQQLALFWMRINKF